MIVWLPIFVLFLFKLLEKQSKYYSIIGGIIFFLVSLTHLYYSVFITMFSIVFFAIYIFRQKKVSNKTFITNFSILLAIGLISTSILFLSSPIPSDESTVMPLQLHVQFSAGLENFILPTPAHTTQFLSDYGMIHSFYSSFFEQYEYFIHTEHMVFLGYSVIFLSALAVIRYRQEHTWFWLLICGIFVVMRYGLIKNKFSSFKQQIMLASIIGFVILFEFSAIPYYSYAQPIPDIYDEIKNDESKFVVLPAPIGGTGFGELMSHPIILYDQIHHEKPIYGGYESRPSLEAMQSTQTYFLNMFHILGSKDDVIKQDLAAHGLSLFDYFDIKYVTLQKEFGPDGMYLLSINRDRLPIFLSETRQVMSEILSEINPVYEDDRVVVYKIPKPNSSELFLLLGSGWHVFESEENLRATMENFEILIINPIDSERNVTLNLVLGSAENEKLLTVSMNNEILVETNITNTWTKMMIENLKLKPGTNVITFDTDEFTLSESKSDMSLLVKSISIEN